MSSPAISFDGSNPVSSALAMGVGSGNAVSTIDKTAAAIETTVSDIIERRNQSRDYMVANYYDEWTEVVRAIKCRVKPFMKLDVCMYV